MSSTADLEQALATLEGVLRSPDAHVRSQLVGKCMKAVETAYVGDLPYRTSYWSAASVQLLCYCGAAGKGTVRDLLLAGWRPCDDVNYTCPICTKDLRRGEI